jgi:acyl carrier protein
MREIREKIEGLVMESLSDALEELDLKMKTTAESPIYGGDSPLDSNAVVSLVVDLEMKLADELDLIISLTDERAISQKRSPFRNVASMVDYILVLYQEQRNE